MKYKLIHGDSEKVLAKMDDNSVDSIVTDPPYGLSFMGKKWDYDVPSVELWRQVFRVLKPGGHLLSFAGSRTYHRMAVNIEDAGFEIRDQIMWIYGSGFPKSLNIAKAIDKKNGYEGKTIGTRKIDIGMQSGSMHSGRSTEVVEEDVKELSPEAKKWDGWGTALKPAHEPIVVARKPLDGTVVDNVLKHGTGGINIDDTRVGDIVQDTSKNGRDNSKHKESIYESGLQKEFEGKITVGRFPSNVLHDGSDEVVDEFPHTTTWGGNRKEGYTGGSMFNAGGMNDIPANSGSASRFFKELKFTKQEHESIVLARKPLDGTVVDNVLKHGTGGLNIEESRVGDEDTRSPTSMTALGQNSGWNAHENKVVMAGSANGRFPSNVIHDGSEEVVKEFPETGKSTGGRSGNKKGIGADGIYGKFKGGSTNDDPGYGDEGSAARYFKELKFTKQEHESIVLARKPLDGTVIENVVEHGTGGLNIDGCRINTDENLNGGGYSKGDYDTKDTIMKLGVKRLSGEYKQPDGRFPANIIHDGSDEVVSEFPITKSGSIKEGTNQGFGNADAKVYGKSKGVTNSVLGSEGSASRFFYCAKASKQERNKGFDIELNSNERPQGEAFGNGNSVTEHENQKDGNYHPTVKPVDLMKYLCRLVTPPNGIVLDPFMGSGTTGIAATVEGFNFLGIEMSEEYIKIANTRISHWVEEKEELIIEERKQRSIFDEW